LPTEWTVVATPLDGGVGLYGVGGYTTLDVWAVGGTASGPADIFWSGMLPWTSLGLVPLGRDGLAHPRDVFEHDADERRLGGCAG
jgi:hypothetical protein